jgi:hypothetical protein
MSGNSSRSGAGSGGGSGEHFSVDPWEMHGEGREFEKISNDFARASLGLEQSLAGLGTPWGTDEPGSGFGTEYQQARETVIGALHGIADRLGQIGTGLHGMADHVTDTDGGITADFGRVATSGAPGAVPPGGASAGGTR